MINSTHSIGSPNRITTRKKPIVDTCEFLSPKVNQRITAIKILIPKYSAIAVHILYFLLKEKKKEKGGEVCRLKRTLLLLSQQPLVASLLFPSSDTQNR